MTKTVPALLAVALAALMLDSTISAEETYHHQAISGRSLQQDSGACTQTEFFCAAGDVFKGDVHGALNSPGACTFDPGELPLHQSASKSWVVPQGPVNGSCV